MPDALFSLSPDASVFTRRESNTPSRTSHTIREGVRYAGPLANRVRQITLEAARYMPESIALSPSALNTLSSATEQIQSTSTPLSMLSSWLQVDSAVSSAQLGWSILKQSSVYLGLQVMLLAKQTSDFALTFLEWIHGRAQNLTMVNQTVNTCLTWIPFALRTSVVQGFAPAVQFLPLVTLSLMIYAFVDEAFRFMPKDRIPSPTLQLITKALSNKPRKSRSVNSEHTR